MMRANQFKHMGKSGVDALLANSGAVAVKGVTESLRVADL